MNLGAVLVLGALAGKLMDMAPTTTTTPTIAIDPGLRGKEPPPRSETGTMSFAAWQLKYGGSNLDYEDWLKGV